MPRGSKSGPVPTGNLFHDQMTEEDWDRACALLDKEHARSPKIPKGEAVFPSHVPFGPIDHMPGLDPRYVTERHFRDSARSQLWSYYRADRALEYLKKRLADPSIGGDLRKMPLEDLEAYHAAVNRDATPEEVRGDPTIFTDRYADVAWNVGRYLDKTKGDPRKLRKMLGKLQKGKGLGWFPRKAEAALQSMVAADMQRKLDEGADPQEVLDVIKGIERGEDPLGWKTQTKSAAVKVPEADLFYDQMSDEDWNRAITLVDEMQRKAPKKPKGEAIYPNDGLFGPLGYFLPAPHGRRYLTAHQYKQLARSELWPNESTDKALAFLGKRLRDPDVGGRDADLTDEDVDTFLNQTNVPYSRRAYYHDPDALWDMDREGVLRVDKGLHKTKGDPDKMRKVLGKLQQGKGGFFSGALRPDERRVQEMLASDILGKLEGGMNPQEVMGIIDKMSRREDPLDWRLRKKGSLNLVNPEAVRPFIAGAICKL